MSVSSNCLVRLTFVIMLQRLKTWYILALARRLPDCKETIRAMSDAMERTPSFRQRILIRLHMHICEWCKRYKEQLLLIRKGSREMDYAAPSTEALSNNARERMKEALKFKG